MRIALGLEYNGCAFYGWQRQREVPSVQAALEEALSFVANQTIETTCAGRTDAGVHATGQVVHFDTTAERSDYSWLMGTNSRLPGDIAVLWAQQVAPDFHARFSALSRRYRYVLLNRCARPALLRHTMSWFPRPLNVERMQQASQYLLGEHDFNSFRAAECQAHSSVRHLMHIALQRDGDEVSLDIQANGFLHHMVRNIMGTLFEVGLGHRPPEWMQEVLAAKDRKSAGPTAPPQGLSLVEVTYPESALRVFR